MVGSNTYNTTNNGKMKKSPSFITATTTGTISTGTEVSEDLLSLSEHYVRKLTVVSSSNGDKKSIAASTRQQQQQLHNHNNDESSCLSMEFNTDVVSVHENIQQEENDNEEDDHDVQSILTTSIASDEALFDDKHDETDNYDDDDDEYGMFMDTEKQYR
mmetsp:Transcript_28620/g.40186  ORF Transcript_28620/g.40186 Transcript_28620/m.40186 type:complete len:159 (-) Transcript_28620:133-609(-)